MLDAFYTIALGVFPAFMELGFSIASLAAPPFVSDPLMGFCALVEFVIAVRAGFGAKGKARCGFVFEGFFSTEFDPARAALFTFVVWQISRVGSTLFYIFSARFISTIILNVVLFAVSLVAFAVAFAIKK